MKKRNKKYQPRPISRDPVSHAIHGVATLGAGQIAEMMTPVRAAVDLLKQGRAYRDDWNVICQALNVGEALALGGIGPNLLPQLNAGQDALLAIGVRMAERGRTPCYGAELAAIDEALLMYRAQIGLCTQAEMGRAIERVIKMHRAGAMQDVAQVFERMKEAA